MTPAKKFFLILGGVALLFSLGVISAVAYARHQGFITVRVKEGSPGGDDIALSVPAVLLELGLPLIPREELRHSSPHFRENAVLFRTAMRELKDVPDCDLVTVDGSDEHVRIRKVGGDLIVDVHDHGDKVFVSVPVRTATKVARWM